MRLMRRLFALLAPWAALLGACDGDPSSPGPAADAGVALTARFALGDRVFEAGDARACVAPAVPAELAGWPRFWVAAGAGPGGAGTEAAPFATLAEALAAAGDAPAVVVLGPGEYAGELAPTGPFALLGSCAAETRLVGPADGVAVTAFGTGRLQLEGVHIAGGSLGVDAARLDDVVLRGVRLTGQAQAAVRLREVAFAALDGSVIRDQGGRGVVALDSAVALRGSLVGPGVEVGVLGAFDPARPGGGDCAAHPSPVCPLSSAVSLEGTLIQGASFRGVDVEAGLAWLRESLVDGVRAADDEAVGVRLGRSWFALEGGFAVRSSAGLGLALESSRGVAAGIEVADNAGGGVAISRAAEPAAGAAAWPALPARFGGPPAVEFPGWEWLPRPDEALPPALRRDQAPAMGQTWPRMLLKDMELRDNAVFGLRAADHVVEVEGGAIRGTRGADSAALVLGQIADRPADDATADLVALSSVRGTTIEDNGGLGLVVSRAALLTADGPWTPARVLVEGVTLQRNARIGAAVLEAVAEVSGATLTGNGGVGLWLAGSHARVRGVDVADTVEAEVPGRDGPIRAGDGLVVQGTTRFPGAVVDVADARLTGSARAGLLVVADEPDRAFGGALRIAAAEANGADGVILGANPDLAVEGVELAARDAAEVPPPALPLPGIGD